MKKRKVLVSTGLVAGVLGTIAANPVSSAMSTAIGLGAAASPSASPVSLTTSTGAGRPSAKATAATAKTIAGDAVQEPYGTVQAEITVLGRHITGVRVVQVPGGFNRQFADAAIPTLTSEILSAQSANVSVVSGATYVSTAFLQSVDSAVQRI